MNKIVVSVITFLALISNAFAGPCPAINKIPDFNCDGEVRIVFLGDSLVYGFGDTKNGNKGGYVLRAQKSFPDVTLVNLGEQGLMTRELLSDVNKANKANNKMGNELRKADLVILDLGRNDRWLFGLPIEAWRNLKKTADFIRKSFKSESGTSPFVITSVIMLPNRGSQGPWVKELDSFILKSNSKNNPADLRFDLVSKRLLSTDQIHPTPKGYDALAAAFKAYMLKSGIAKMNEARPDEDNDNIPDVFEGTLFDSDPTLQDTDGDGIIDGDDVTILVPTPTPTPTPTP